MGIHEHEVRTKTDQLIAAVEALTAQTIALQVAMSLMQAHVSDIDRRSSQKIGGGDMPFRVS